MIISLFFLNFSPTNISKKKTKLSSLEFGFSWTKFQLVFRWDCNQRSKFGSSRANFVLEKKYKKFAICV